MARQVKRYTFTQTEPLTPCGKRGTMGEADYGEWVRYEDVAPILAEAPPSAAPNRPHTAMTLEAILSAIRLADEAAGGPGQASSRDIAKSVLGVVFASQQ